MIKGKILSYRETKYDTEVQNYRTMIDFIHGIDSSK